MIHGFSTFAEAWEAHRANPPPRLSLAEIVALLFTNEPTYQLTEDICWGQQVSLLRSGKLIEVTHEIYWYWLEVLPPKFLSRGLFAFAEGQEALLLFLARYGRYYARQTDWPTTFRFCEATGLSFNYGM